MKQATVIIFTLILTHSVHCQSIELLQLELKYNSDWKDLLYDSVLNGFCIYKSIPDKTNLPTICGSVFKYKKFTIDNYIHYKKTDLEVFNCQLLNQEKSENEHFEYWILIWECDDPVEVNSRSKTLEHVIYLDKMLYSINYTNYVEHYEHSLESAKAVLNSIKINSP